jgi:hypothetical protein
MLWGSGRKSDSVVPIRLLGILLSVIRRGKEFETGLTAARDGSDRD